MFDEPVMALPPPSIPMTRYHRPAVTLASVNTPPATVVTGVVVAPCEVPDRMTQFVGFVPDQVQLIVQGVPTTRESKGCTYPV